MEKKILRKLLGQMMVRTVLRRLELLNRKKRILLSENVENL